MGLGVGLVGRLETDIRTDLSSMYKPQRVAGAGGAFAVPKDPSRGLPDGG